ncbi:flagellar basal body L-ring protein FlgH [Xylophilus rhododendri]|uniref:Flagellar L-ring protein n=1 Tax=Xylophilus rhododendri TaxID=2697032 RepID=A0A857J2V7_9BURK|nr:flagellar basal body L-ring protein FlgH [Xylophilus rhododendri]QHI97987.1 flagellar basal body L-ring protein FlgH [Xylophilus rhododendri]
MKPVARSFLFALMPLATLLTGCETMQPKVEMPVTAAPQLVYPIREPVSATGGLFSTATYRQAFEDRRARLVGDNVTINIVENVSASQTSTSTVDRNGTVKGGITALPFFGASSLAAKTTVAAADANTFSGKGGTQSANTFSGAITATVVQVLPNGHLVVTGEKQIGVNENVDTLRFSGTIDPRAIQAGSTIASTQVANVRIESRGKGQAGEAQQMGWLSRVFLNVLPF